MAALLWLLIPIAAAVIAGAWGSWAARRPSGIPDSDGVAGYERFRAAMERAHPEEAEVAEVQADSRPATAPIAPIAATAQPAPDRTAPAAD